MPSNTQILRLGAVAAAATLSLTLAACSTSDDAVSPSPSTAEQDHDHEAEHDHGNATEEAGPNPRIVLTYDGGLVVLDANSLETVADFSLDGFNRISDAGDGRHVAVSTTGGWAFLDAGAWTEPHGDHNHSFSTEPSLTDVLVPAETPGHVVNHDGLTALFDDGTGNVVVLESAGWTEAVEHGDFEAVREYTTAEAHHGVAIATEENLLLVTRGNEEGRTGAMVLDADGNELASSDSCPGVHGEAALETTAGEELLMVGCENGVLIIHGDHVHQILAPVEYGRTGNLYVVEGSDLVVGDYKTDREGGIGLNQIVYIDPETETHTIVDPFSGADVRYTWRDIARGEQGEVLVLGTDGALRVLDASGAVVNTIPVTAAWDIPEEWQTAHPAVTVLAGMAYVTEPATGTVHIVDYVAGSVWKSVQVGYEMNEIVGVDG